MYKTNLIGIFLCATSGVLWVFKVVTGLMEREQQITIFTIKQIWGIKWIEHIPWEKGRDIALQFSQAQLSLILLVLGIIFLIIGAFKKN